MTCQTTVVCPRGSHLYLSTFITESLKFNVGNRWLSSFTIFCFILVPRRLYFVFSARTMSPPSGSKSHCVYIFKSTRTTLLHLMLIVFQWLEYLQVRYPWPGIDQKDKLLRWQKFCSHKQKKYMLHSKFFFIIKTCLNPTRIWHLNFLTVPVLLSFLIFKWQWKQIKTKEGWYSCATEEQYCSCLSPVENTNFLTQIFCVSDVKKLTQEIKNNNKEITKQAKQIYIGKMNTNQMRWKCSHCSKTALD